MTPGAVGLMVIVPKNARQSGQRSSTAKPITGGAAPRYGAAASSFATANCIRPSVPAVGS